ncbi:MAG: lytic transglycosylase domain-containing protein [Candidatus Gracilibacteria bacterium]
MLTTACSSEPVKEYGPGIDPVKLAQAMGYFGGKATNATAEEAGSLAEEFCAMLGYETAAQCYQCILEPRTDVANMLECSTRPYFMPGHPQAITGNVSDERIKKYRSTQKGKPGIQELINFFGEILSPGKIDIYRIDPLMLAEHTAVGKFLRPIVDQACETVGLSEEECVLYRIISFENSGELWAKSSKNAVGPGQLMPFWIKKGIKNVGDGLYTKNFFVQRDSKGRTTFDGRYDPVSNVEAGARIMKYFIGIYGINHPDFVMLAYNQGETAVNAFISEWAEKHLGVKFSFIKKKWNDAHPDDPFQYSYFLNFLYNRYRIGLASMQMDADLVKKHMGSDNGGAGYVSKIIALNVAANNPGKYGIKIPAAKSLPVVMDENQIVSETWNSMFEPVIMPKDTNLREFAKTNKYDIDVLTFINRQVRNIDAKFDRAVRIWLPRQGVNQTLLAQIKDAGNKMIPSAPVAKKDTTSRNKGPVIKDNHRHVAPPPRTVPRNTTNPARSGNRHR